MTLEKQMSHVGVRFYRIDGVEIVLVPLLRETAKFARSAGDVKAARKRGTTLAVLDLGSGTLTAVRPGTVTVTVASGGLTGSATVTLDR